MDNQFDIKPTAELKHYCQEKNILEAETSKCKAKLLLHMKMYF